MIGVSLYYLVSVDVHLSIAGIPADSSDHSSTDRRWPLIESFALYFADRLIPAPHTSVQKLEAELDAEYVSTYL